MNDRGNEAAPRKPPLDMVQSMMVPYFEPTSPQIPLWKGNGFLRMMNQAASQDGPTNRATIVWSNNLVLKTLGPKNRSQKLKRRSQAHVVASEPDESPMELLFLKTFLENAERALQRTKQLSSPSLLSRQTLLSLLSVINVPLAGCIDERDGLIGQQCLVAQQHWWIECYGVGCFTKLPILHIALVSTVWSHSLARPASAK